MRAAVVLSGILVLLAACAEPGWVVLGCPRIGWFDVGFTQGESGEPTSLIDKYAEVCPEARDPNVRETWLAGWEAGHSRYCTPSGAFRLGREKGYRVRPETCPAWASAEELHKANRRGLDCHDLEEDMDEVSREAPEGFFEILGHSLELTILRERLKKCQEYRP